MNALCDRVKFFRYEGDRSTNIKVIDEKDDRINDIKLPEKELKEE